MAHVGKLASAGDLNQWLSAATGFWLISKDIFSIDPVYFASLSAVILIFWCIAVRAQGSRTDIMRIVKILLSICLVNVGNNRTRCYNAAVT